MTLPKKRESDNSEESLQRLLYRVIAALVFLLPVVIFPFEDDIFSLPKATVLRVLFLFAAASWLVLVFQQKKVVYRRTPLDLPLSVFFLFLSISSVFSFNCITSFFADAYERHENFFTWLIYIGLFLLVSQGLSRKEHARRILEMMVAASGLVSAYAIAQQLGLDFLDLKVEGFAVRQSLSTFGNAIYLGGYLSLIIPIGLALIVTERRWAKRILWCVLAFLATLSLIFTFSRGAWVGFLSALFVFVLLVAIKGLNNMASRRQLRNVLLGITVLIVLAVSISQLLPSTSGLIARRLQTLVALERAGTGRLPLWDSALRLVSKRPLLGWGLNTFKDVLPYNKPEFKGAKWIDRPHNQIMSIAYDGGAPLLLAYFWLIISLFFLGRRALRTTADNSEYFLVSGLLAAAFGYLVHEQFFFSLVGITPLFWTIMGLTVVISASATRKRELKLRLPSFWRQFITALIVLLAAILALASISLVFANYFHSRGLQLETENEFLEAARYQLTAVTLNPWESRYKFSYAQDLENQSVVTGDPSYVREALPIYEAGLRQNSLDHELMFAMGKSYYTISFLEKSNDYSRAKELLEKAIQLRPFVSGEPYMWLGLAYLQEDNSSRAVRVLERARKLGGAEFGDAPILFALAQGYHKLGETDKARELLKQVLNLEPDYDEARELLGQLGSGQD